MKEISHIFFRINFQFKESINFNKDEIDHFKSLRIYQEDKILEFRNGQGSSFFYESFSKSNTGTLIKKSESILKKSNIQIATAIPKSQRFEFLLQKGTEIGIDAFHFINFFQSDRKEINLDRTNKIILEACSQSKRHSIPSVFIYNSLEKFLEEHKSAFYLEPESLELLSIEKIENKIPIIGPEGGFRKEEIECLNKFSIPGFNIGNEILKIETAGIFIASILKYSKL